MLTIETLLNIQIQELKQFFTQHAVPGRTSLFSGGSTRGKYIEILNFINAELKNPKPKFTKAEFDLFLFEHLFFSNTNYQFLYKYDNFFASVNTSIDDAIATFKGITELRFNRWLSNTPNFNLEYNIYTTRIDSENDKLKAVHFILQMGKVESRFGETNVFIGITIDLVNKVLLIKFNYKQFEEIRKEPLSLVKEIKNVLMGFGKSGKPFSELNLNIVSLGDKEAREAIYFMFEELSREAENLLNSRINPETDAKIIAFLNSMGIGKVEDDYIEQIKAVVFQDISKEIGDDTFEHGWVFRFHFREGDHTRASSTQENKLPVYSSKTFWQLKELIYREQEMYEAGFHWFMSSDDPEEFVDIRIESRNDTIILHYYYRMRMGRREKEQFVIQKVTQYL
ncbi:hypothetical protein [Paenibacillus cymbidii]|uniref:hypothetical protein n=1 Tax=Paenibacillus cymbidii TaxID=1639034 RepID=UPI00108194F7|nr:hypothetical protein [Paenibacillus cymbidii]